MNNPQEAMNQLIDHIKSGAHFDIVPGIHIVGLIEDQNSEKNIGLNQALFSTSIHGIDVMVRLTSLFEFPPDFFLVANDDLDSESLVEYNDLALLEILNKKIMARLGGDGSLAFSTVVAATRAKHDLIVKDGIQSISIYCLKLSDENAVATIGFDPKDEIYVYDESNQGVINIADFLDAWS